jgi:hypothetical protein
LKIKKGLTQDATFPHPDPGNAKADKSRENEAKRDVEKDPGQKRVVNHTLDVNIIA